MEKEITLQEAIKNTVEENLKKENSQRKENNNLNNDNKKIEKQSKKPLTQASKKS